MFTYVDCSRTIQHKALKLTSLDSLGSLILLNIMSLNIDIIYIRMTFSGCRPATRLLERCFKASSHIDDTTRHDSIRHDPFFRSPYNHMDQFTHMQHDNVWSSRQKAATTKIALEPIFVVCRSDSITKTAKENSLHRNLTWVYKFMTQE